MHEIHGIGQKSKVVNYAFHDFMIFLSVCTDLENPHSLR